MKNSKKLSGAALAIAAASLISVSSIGTAGEKSGTKMAKNVHCYDVNKCKGHNDCKTAENKCKGHAKCKGHGFVSMSAKACDHIGGKVGK